MTPANRAVRDLIARLDRQIEILQARLSRRYDLTAARWIEDIRHRRYVLARGLLNRRLVGQDKIVDFTAWRTGNGLLLEPTLDRAALPLPDDMEPTPPSVR
jgi:hypothetical protein